jgi:hypothetical protein
MHTAGVEIVDKVDVIIAFANSDSRPGAGTGPNRSLSSEAWKTRDKAKKKAH